MAAKRGGGRKAPAPSFSLIPHTSEAAVLAHGRTWGELHMNAAKGLMALWGLEPGKAQWNEKVSFQSDTPEDLLVVWLEELVYRLSARGEVWAGGRAIEATGRSLELNAAWRALGVGEKPQREVKAATYHGLKVARNAGLFSATVILDV